MAEPYDYLMKLLLVGSPEIGKSSIMLRYTEDSFSSSYISTIGVEFRHKANEVTTTTGDKTGKCKLQIWDTAGHERFRAITAAYYRGAGGLMIVYDVTNQKSFDHIHDRMRQVKELASNNIQIMIVGNKCDIDSGLRMVSTDRGKLLAEEYGAMFMEVSAKTGENIDLAFTTLAQTILSNVLQRSIQGLIVSYIREKSSFSSILLDNSDVTIKLSDSLCDKQLISSGEGKPLQEKTSPQEKAESLIHAIDETITRSPGSLIDIIEEMGRYDCLKKLVKSVREQEKMEKDIDKFVNETEEKLEALEKRMREERAAIDKQMEEVMKKAYRDNPVPTGPIKPPRFPDVTTSTTEELIEWMRIEFEQLEKETIRVHEERKERDLERLKEGIDEIFEEMDRKEEELDQWIAENKQKAKATVGEFKEQLSLADKQQSKQLMTECQELHESQKKSNEETLDRYLETERRIDAYVEAIDSGTYEIKSVEKSYKSGLVPEWTHPSLSKVSCTVTPVYRTIEKFQEKRENNERIITESFYTTRGGYKMTLEVYPNGFGPCEGSFVSVFIYLMKGDNDNVLSFPFTGNVIIEALNWSEDDGHVEKIISIDESTSHEYRQRVTDGDRAKRGRGNRGFLPHLDLQQYLLNDMMCLRVSFESIQFFTGSPVPSWYTVINSSIPPCTVTMHQYSRLKKTSSPWYSKPFYTSERGYKLQLKVVSSGRGSGEGTHVSVYVYPMKGEYDEQLQWPFNATITIHLLNWSRDSDHIEDSIPHYEGPIKYRTRVIEGDRALGGIGFEKFVSYSVLNNDNSKIKYINEDKLCFRITSVDKIL